METSNSIIKKLCIKLKSLTDSNRCVWTETAENNRYRLDLENGRIDIEYVNELMTDELPYYTLRMYDSNNERIDTVVENIGYEKSGPLSSLYNAVMAYFDRQKVEKVNALISDLDTLG